MTTFAYRIYLEDDSTDPNRRARITRTDGRIDQYTGNSLTLPEAERRLKAAGVVYKVVTDVIISGNGRD